MVWLVVKPRAASMQVGCHLPAAALYLPKKMRLAGVKDDIPYGNTRFSAYSILGYGRKWVRGFRKY